MKENIRFTLNGKPTELAVDSSRKLLWVLRSDLGLTGTKYGCGESYCGACTVLLDNDAVRSCQVSMKDVEGKEVVTIEGLALHGGPSGEGALHPLQKAFMDEDALQCGYCTPGMIMDAYALLVKTPAPSRAEIVREMDDHICRCGTYTRIIRAIQKAAGEMKGGR